jgi:hypothetical protein
MNVQARMEMKIHIELVRDQFGLIDPPCPWQVDIKFLQCHDIGMHARYYFCYSHRKVFSVIADAAVHIVCHDRKSERTGHTVKI